MNILYGTHWISEDEPCIALYEVDMQSPGSKGFRRYQIIYVMRDDNPAEYKKDLGPSSDFTVDGVYIPGGAKIDGRYWIEETVGRLRDLADYHRVKPSFDKVELACTRSGAERIKT